MSELDHDSGSESSDYMPERKFKCNWCSKLCKKLVEGKRYCAKCHDNCFRECLSCKRPIASSEMYTLDEKRCNTCFRKLEKARAKRQEKRDANALGKRRSDDEPPLKGEKWYVLLPISKFINEADIKQTITK